MKYGRVNMAIFAQRDEYGGSPISHSNGPDAAIVIAKTRRVQSGVYILRKNHCGSVRFETNKIGTNLKSPQKRKDKKRREMEAQGLEGKNNECRLNNERMKETGQKTLL